jgi:hypothetical protein
MSFTERKRERKASQLGADLEDEFPKIPSDFVRKFPELEEFNRQTESFWSNVKLALIRYEQRINDLENP